MAPSSRVPRVPRAPGRDGGPAADTGRSQDLPRAGGHERPDLALGGDAAHDAGPSPSPARVTVHNGPKVTRLDPAGSSGSGPRPAPQPEEDPAVPPKRSRPTLSGLRRGKAEHAAGQAVESADVLAFPEPPRKRRRRRILIGAAVAAALVAGLFAVLLFTPLVAVRSVSVQGTHLLTAQQVESALEPVRGKPLATVGSDEVNRLVGQFVQIKSARARAVPPDTLVVEIVERVPVALVKQGGKLLVVDGDGVVLGEARDTSQYAVPVIDGSAMPMGQAVFKAVTAVLAALPSDVLAQLATASAQSPDSVELKLTDGRSVVWGNADERELKAKVLAALMKAAQSPEKGQAAARVFDVSTPRHPVTR